MKGIFLAIIYSLTAIVLHAQLYAGSDANSLFIKSSETLSYDGLTLIPSADFTLTNFELNKTEAYNISTYAPYNSGNYIKRYFRFSNTTPAFTGTLTFSYAGAILIGPGGSAIPEADLRLNIFNGTNWGVTTDLPNQTSDFVSSSLTSRTLKVITLASSTGPLPVTWLQFIAAKKESTAVLNWSTATEENAQDFLVQHSITGSGWQTLGTVKAAGNSSTRRDYTFTHYSPLPDYNYYRLIQRDINGKYDYSKVVSVLVDKEDVRIKVFPNPVHDGKINVLLKEAAQLRLFDSMGRLVYSQWSAAGFQAIDITTLSNGVYFIKVNSESTTITIKR